MFRLKPAGIIVINPVSKLHDDDQAVYETHFSCTQSAPLATPTETHTSHQPKGLICRSQAHFAGQGPMELPDQRTAGAADAGDGNPIRMSSEPAAAVDGTVPVNDTEADSKEQGAEIFEDIDIDALLAIMDDELPLDENWFRRIIEGGSEMSLGKNNVTEDTVERNDDLEGVGMENTAQEIDEGGEYDELFDDDGPDRSPTTPPSSTPHVPQVEPPAPQATPPSQTEPSACMPKFDLSTLDLPTVMSNITTLKSAIIANHLLLTRFLHLQSAYRTLSTTLIKERHILAQAQSAIARMREEAGSVSHDSPLLQFQIKQLKDEILRERATRMQYEDSTVQYQEKIRVMRTEIGKLRKVKAKLELGEKRAQETLKEGDTLRGKVVGLMSENKSLTKRVEELGEQEVVRQNKALEEEIMKLRERVVQLEGNNIRLKAGRSILAGGDGNTGADIQPSAALQTSPTRTFAIAGALFTPPRPSPPKPQRVRAATSSSSEAAAPQGQNTDPIDISDDEATNQANDDHEVVFVGANNISATLESFQIASPSMESQRLPQLQPQPSQQQQQLRLPLPPPPLPLQQSQPAQTPPPPSSPIWLSKHRSINSISNRDTP
ncbi:hypothetical protein BGX38DRAFT_1138464 [Terfezia claveryi]|nr:hypothetical protein BGX38DRAFT_1138464 [Terfezia claveryi]